MLMQAMISIIITTPMRITDVLRKVTNLIFLLFWLQNGKPSLQDLSVVCWDKG